MHRFAFMFFGFALAACVKKESVSPAPDPLAAHHEHVAPHGGRLVELGPEAYHLEFVRDLSAGRLTAYVLDAHAENFVRIGGRSISLEVRRNGKNSPLVLHAVANSATGETMDETSQFDAEAEWLKIPAAFDGVISTLEIRGTKFENIAVRLP